MTEKKPDDKPTPANLPGAPTAPKPAAPLTRPSLEEAKKFGSVGEDGHVYVEVRGENIPVGAFPDATEDEALAYFARKFAEAETQISLLENRVSQGTDATSVSRTIGSLREQVAARGMVGDITDLEDRLDALEQAASRLTEEQEREAAAAKERARTEREAIVKAAEDVAEQDPAQTHWKNSSARMNDLFNAWKTAQKENRLHKSVEDELWKRFRNARTTFDKHRRAYFSQLDQDNAKAKKAKEGLIAEAEALSGSTDWGETSIKYRELMDRWKKAPRASRKEDDALWARFRAAQDVFFNARAAANEEADREFAENLKVKEALLEKARAILPVKDPDVAKAKLAPILDEWDRAGMVPRNDLRRVENELKKVQDAISEAEQAEWERSNPETQARANSMVAQLREAITGLEDELATARAKGDSRAIAKAEEALDARRKWLDQVESAS
ncbi:DUF349 domain-containing protein [Kocuria sp. TGY1127_2]|uniref:DUF349 domain-containing protein n=1 Tax=Kocuria sp. TGY1127_2 TaxID=2711328 RepID=UPI001FACD5E8|nr:DUF349 domain-containing protein [Kocuria sp. TGY1127_2]